MEPFETFEHAGCVIELHWDDDPMSPADWDQLGTLYQMRSEWRSIEDAGSQAQEANERGGTKLLVRYLQLVHGIYAIPFDVYEHGGATIREAPIASHTRCSGYIATDQARCDELGCSDPMEGLRSELETWRAWFEGNVIGYVVESNGQHVDSCWGFYPDDEKDPWEYVRQEARDAAEYEQQQREKAANQDIATR